MKRIIFAAAVSASLFFVNASASVAANVTITMADVYALHFDNAKGMDPIQGKTRDAFLVYLEGSDVTVPDASVIDFGTYNGKFIVAVGLLAASNLACVQTSKEARLHAIETVTQTGDYSIKGKFDHYQYGTSKSDYGDSYGTTILADCTFKRLP